MEKSSEEWDFIIWASGFYLVTENLPEDSLTWEEKRLETEDHAWEPFEYHSANQIWENEALADAISKDLNRIMKMK